MMAVESFTRFASGGRVQRMVDTDVDVYSG